MEEKKITRDESIQLLAQKYASLQGQGLDRFPKRSDFTEREVVAIKAFLGPWPRALETAGIKPPRNDDHAQKNKEKRIRAKRNRIAALKNLKQEQKQAKMLTVNSDTDQNGMYKNNEKRFFK